jgi:hypothetical protein
MSRAFSQVARPAQEWLDFALFRCFPDTRILFYQTYEASHVDACDSFDK